ncbi:hypothetical protein M2263_004572 [Providencia alcalifaciens]|nr:hypothetical protein [Providencia alcalifaciens]
MLKAYSLIAPYLPQMRDGIINNDDLSVDNKIYVEVAKYELAAIGDEILVNFGFVISSLSLVIAMFFSFLINISLIRIPLSTGKSYQLSVLWSDEYSSMYTVLLFISSFVASIHPAIKAVK